MTGFKVNDQPFTYATEVQLKERDPLLNKYLLDTLTFSIGGAITGLGVGVLLRNPKFWSYFFAGFGAQAAYARGPVKFKFL